MPKNLKQWIEEDPSCLLCKTQTILRYILTSLWNTWKLNHVLQQLLSILEQRSTVANALPYQISGFSKTTTFIPAGQLPKLPTGQEAQLSTRHHKISQQISNQSWSCDLPYRSSYAFWSYPVHWEAPVGEAYEWKSVKYLHIAAEVSALRKSLELENRPYKPSGLDCQMLSRVAATALVWRERAWSGLQGNRQPFSKGAHPGDQMSLLVPLEVSWVYRWNIKEGGCSADDPSKVINLPNTQEVKAALIIERDRYSNSCEISDSWPFMSFNCRKKREWEIRATPW